MFCDSKFSYILILYLTDGYWSEWSDWDTCTMSCGGGNQTHTRTCIQPINGGNNCYDINNENDFEVQTCNDQPCSGGN